MIRRPEPEAYLAARLLELLTRIALERRTCKYCDAELWFVRHKNGATAAYTADGTNHFANCPQAGQARADARRAARRDKQAKIFETAPIPE